LNTLRYFSSSNPIAVIDAKPDVFKVKNDENSHLIDAGMEATLSFPNDVIGTLSCHLRVSPRMSIVPIIPEMRMKVVCENGDLEVFNHIVPTLYHWIQVSVKTGPGGKARKTRVEKLYKPSEAGSKGEEWWSTYVQNIFLLAHTWTYKVAHRYRYQLEAFVDRIKGREPHTWVSEEDSVANMEWIEKVYEKASHLA
jgi:predicted dehydrogenase